jgi:hypothetical protein
MVSRPSLNELNGMSQVVMIERMKMDEEGASFEAVVGGGA